MNIVDEADDHQADHNNNSHPPHAKAVNPVIPATFAPLQRPAPNERATIQAAMANNEVIDMCRRADNPINEFNTEGYIL